jgi:hypothetical protein
MKKFLIINGKDIFIRLFKDHAEAVEFCQNYMDQSKLLHVIEIKEIDIKI